MVAEEESMAMGSERSKPPLHNFTLPYGLKWGNQKFLRCAKLDSDGEEISAAAVHRRSNGSSEPLIGRRRSEAAALGLRSGGSDERVRGTESGRRFRDDVEDGIAAVRKKLMCDLQAATDKMRDEILRTGLKDEADEDRRQAVVEGDKRSPTPPPASAPSVPPTSSKTISPVGPSQPTTGAADPTRPWNLRTRRSGSRQPKGFSAAGSAGVGESNVCLKVDVTMPNASPSRGENRSPRLRSSSAAAAVGGSGEKRERAKFSVSLSRREIEEDFAAILRHRPPRRPKKRAKYIQKDLDTLFPGLWLTEITPDLYKVPDDQ